MKTYELSSLEMRKVGLYFKDVLQVSLKNKTQRVLKEVLDTLTEGNCADVLEKLNGLTLELNQYYKEVEPDDYKKASFVILEKGEYKI